MYPDQNLYPANSVPAMVRAINNAFLRADQICRSDGKEGPYWFAPIVADAEAGFGGTLNAFELMKALIEAGAAAAHFDDQLSSAKKCGHLGGKVVVPIREFVQKLIAARLAADVMRVPTILIGPHRRRQRPAPAQRYRPARLAIPRRNANRRGLLRLPGRH
jgi:isocitrate lyase